MKLTRPQIYGGLVVIALAAFWFTQPKEAAPVATQKVVKKTARQAVVTDFTEEDYKVHFAPLNEMSKNAFMPLVKRQTTSGSIDGIPLEISMGEANWIYTGLAEVDGVSMALLENTMTGEGVFLKVGEKWKGATVGAIASQSLTLIGLDGKARKVTLETLRQTAQENQAAEAGFQPIPLNPGTLRGPIGGGGLSIQPERRAGRTPDTANAEVSEEQ